MLRRKLEYIIKMDFRKVDSEDGTGLGLCPFVDFGVANVELSGFATRELVSQPSSQRIIYSLSYSPQ
jgi:hypothetical protein